MTPGPDAASPRSHPAAPTSAAGGVFAALMFGGAVAVVLGVYGRLHGPTGIAVNVAGFSSPLTVKVWLATGAAFLAVVQLVSAAAMYGKLPGVRAPEWTGTAHRWSGRIAFLLSVPVAVHCLYALGLQTYDLRVTVHSLLGCLFYGAFSAKMLVLTLSGWPGWVLPLAGGLVFTALMGLWLCSSVWFFATTGVTF